MGVVGLKDPVTRLPKVGAKRADDLAKLGVVVAEDLLTLWPRRHQDRSHITPIAELVAGETVTVIGLIRRSLYQPRFGGQGQLRLTLEDGTGHLDLTFFHAQWLRTQLIEGRRILVTGKADRFQSKMTMTHPEFEVLAEDQTPLLGMVPVYPLAGALKQRFMQDMMRSLVPRLAPQAVDPLPLTLKAREQLPDRAWATIRVHFPADAEEKEKARQRIVFDEFLRMSLAVLWLHHPDATLPARPLKPDGRVVQELLQSLPFTLTSGQMTAWQSIAQDIATERPMARLLQGDVGSGKTVVAGLAMASAVSSGLQAALMVPTELLAEQHTLVLSRLFEPLGVPVISFTGRGHGRAQTLARLSTTEPLIVVGTQALLSEGVAFGGLGIVVVDEQHRFGVRQRGRLTEKGYYPHMLVMTATPIPRTLALTVYGDLEVSRIEGLPEGRQPIRTVHLPMEHRREAYVAVMQAVKEGRQAYVICPLVEESEESHGKAVTLMAEGMRKIAGWRVGSVHGKMSSEEKAEVMAKFRAREFDVLVGTTILEVGVDVPNATMMVIEGADRFGLAQLHQLRGRVGRGEHASTCYLLADPATEEATERLKAMVDFDDGLRLAEIDLELRGPGEVLGMRQHGVAGFQLANPLKDLALLEKTRQWARAILSDDPELLLPEHRSLKAWIYQAIQEALPGHVLH